MRLVFSLTVFLSAALLFVVEPLFAKMVLPRLGGTPAVWNTCMVFFQAALLAGYAYAHWTGRFAKQPVLHLAVLLAPFAVLPLAVPDSWIPPSEGSPIGSLLLILSVRVGLPFFVLATSGPLIQRWFERAGEKDPYWLYAASNTGSMIGLLGYPLVLEPCLAIKQQSALWTWAYIGLVVLTAVCAILALRKPPPQEGPVAKVEPLDPGRCLRWVALAAVPSAQLIGVTTYMTTDVASVPLLWVIPLALYLLSFIVVFSGGGLKRYKIWVAMTPFFILALADLLLMGARDPLMLVLPAHLVAFFVVCMLCHGGLAADRPPAAQLTAFYLLISVGGLIGGTLTSLVAPFIFKDVHEYPLALVAACALMPDRSKRKDKVLVPLDVILPACVGLATLGLCWAVSGWPRESAATRAIVVGLPIFLTFPFSRRPIQFALGVAAVFLATLVFKDVQRGVIHSERSFFGVHRITNEYPPGAKDEAPISTITFHYRALTHGTTRHGMQRVDADNKPTSPRDPLTYYGREGPLGMAMGALLGTAPGKRVGVVGLGTGTIASYLESGQRLTYFEIDPAVVRIAEEYFTFLRSARERGVQVSTVLGDARLTLARSDETFDILAIDAFSSDAIPLHLITREAVAKAYLPRLAPGGVLLCHISNRYIDLAPILGDLAGDAGLVCYICKDSATLHEVNMGIAGSVWVALARRVEDLGGLSSHVRWEANPPRAKPIVWTDDRSDLISAIRR